MFANKNRPNRPLLFLDTNPYTSHREYFTVSPSPFSPNAIREAQKESACAFFRLRVGWVRFGSLSEYTPLICAFTIFGAIQLSKC